MTRNVYLFITGAEGEVLGAAVIIIAIARRLTKQGIHYSSNSWIFFHALLNPVDVNDAT